MNTVTFLFTLFLGMALALALPFLIIVFDYILSLLGWKDKNR